MGKKLRQLYVFSRRVTPGNLNKDTRYEISWHSLLRLRKNILILPVDSSHRYKHRNPLRGATTFALLGIICRFTTERDTISPALRRKRSPVFRARRFVRSSRPPDVRDPFPRALTSRTRCKQVFTLFAKRDIRLQTILSSLNSRKNT